MTTISAIFVAAAIAAARPDSAEVGDEIETSAGVVTAMSCARAAVRTGKLEPLASCGMSEVPSGLAVFDVAAGQIYRIAPVKVGTYELEAAFGGGSIDFAGIVVATATDGVPVVEVQEYTVSRRPKAGSFKGCL